MTDELAKEGMSGLQEMRGKGKKKPVRLSKKEKMFMLRAIELRNWSQAYCEVFKYEGTPEQAARLAYQKRIKMSESRDYMEIVNAAITDPDLAVNLQELAFTGDRKTRVAASKEVARVKGWGERDQSQQQGVVVMIYADGQRRTVENTQENPEVIYVKPEPVRQIVD
jgi:hypothetical protein